jgi:hypothetical protein
LVDTVPSPSYSTANKSLSSPNQNVGAGQLNTLILTPLSPVYHLHH